MPDIVRYAPLLTSVLRVLSLTQLHQYYVIDSYAGPTGNRKWHVLDFHVLSQMFDKIHPNIALSP